MDDVVYSVIDTETTGIHPGAHHRIIEIAVIGLDEGGRQVSRWETVLNPERDLGAQHVHGITGADVYGAPTFADIADELAWRLDRTVPVAHNLSFDSRFIDAEYHRLGKPLPAAYLGSGLCTMRLAGRYLPGAGRSLAACCGALGIDIGTAHTAGDDAAAAGRLLEHFIQREPGASVYSDAILAAHDNGWPMDRPAAARTHLRSTSSGRGERGFIGRLVETLPTLDTPMAEGSAARDNEYAALLDRALLDRHLSLHEQDALVKAANEAGISREHVAMIHGCYLASLAAAALADGIVTDDERADLARVALLLELPPQAVDASLAAAAAVARPVGTAAGPAGRQPEPGTRICLTGDMSRPRTEIEELLRRAGYVPHPGVTKKVGLVVASDPDSASGKARKARSYGIPVVGERFLWDVVLSG
ncbi:MULTISPECIES: exonuclease domain-containing protein [unclassified Actinomyces]|uniref:exonuclease domain-containing protein n=1 Tax=unclassified Actinomyces TaxID=2609248 RepID=UPI002017E6C0|nr:MULTISPECIES: exonuclease domain-containing protein [unclassified Actinomyces]MCL3776578.1 DNA polymerase III subunit epsilon [Actinomyces sp. AC-20-1]MCL3788864.1 DNA polymerase III subunit epsilon [Actinomyces sp. 187325]MCL3791030.1 DNA polymerase III subunit epsilon [Actinomyces sp. 186855]MCL3793444.1 DNA polymerase III subunit epsilon [Actinomyces sp. 217892]